MSEDKIKQKETASSKDELDVSLFMKNVNKAISEYKDALNRLKDK